MGRRSGGITGMASSTIASGRLVVPKNALITFKRFKARDFFWPLPVAITSRKRSASPSRSKVSKRRLIAAAPMPPVK